MFVIRFGLIARKQGHYLGCRLEIDTGEGWVVRYVDRATLFN